MKRFFLCLTIVLLIVCMGMVVGCTDADDTTPAVEVPETDSTEESVTLLPVRVGTMATDDLLPLWVAEHEGYLTDAGLDVEIINFQSRLESRAAMTAGEIDAMMTDMIVAAQMTEAEGARAVTVMQTTPAGIIASPDSGITSLPELAGVPVGNNVASILEFILDKALTDAGVDSDDIVIETIEKLPVRLEMLMNNQLSAAVLPWTLFQLAEMQGATALLDEETARDYTSTVLVFSEGFLADAAAPATVDALLAEWDRAVAAINADSDAYRELLIEKANLPEPLRETYVIRQYPKTGSPSQEQFDAVHTWMIEKGYLEGPIPYNEFVYER